jgi:uncharacterized protein YecE (DUF72 family)
MKEKFLVGTSGWSYAWSNFYPRDLPNRGRLTFYSKTFKTVEVNYSFYHLPRTSLYQKWASETPKEFQFTLKLSRFITHIKKLSGVKIALKKFLGHANVLGPKLGPILVQLPPSFRVSPERLERFLRTVKAVEQELEISPKLKIAFEFRHTTWFEKDSEDYIHSLKILRTYNAAFVFAHSSRYPYPTTEPVTADFVYLRFHGPGALFASKYGKEGLLPWLPKIKNWVLGSLDVYTYFNNDVHGYAIEDTKCLIREIIEN